jgi:hypothetical protein
MRFRLPLALAAIALPAMLAFRASLARAQTQTWVQTAELVSSTPTRGGGDWFGGAVALSGGTLLVADQERGSVFVFGQSGTGWTQKEELGPFERIDTLGLSDTIAVLGSGSAGGYKGFVVTYVPSGGTWTELPVLSDPPANSEFGASVALSGTTLVVGAPAGGNGPGTAYVFTQTGMGWVQETELHSADGASGDEFGAAVAISGSTILVLAPNKLVQAPSGTVRGPAYIFTRTGSSWTQQAELLPRDLISMIPGTVFVGAVALSDNTAFVGECPGQGAGGRVLVFTQSGSGWSYAQTLEPGANPTSRFGSVMSLSDSTLLVGSQGTAYFFTESGSSWNLDRVAMSDDSLGLDPQWSPGLASPSFGEAVAISGNTAFVGAPQEQVMTNMGEGIVYGFTLEDVDAGSCDLYGRCGQGNDGGAGATGGGSTGGANHGGSDGCSCKTVPGSDGGDSGGLAVLAGIAWGWVRRARSAPRAPSGRATRRRLRSSRS